MKITHVDIEDRCPSGRICVRWSGFDRENITQVKAIPGRNYVKTRGRHWHVPLDLETCRSLRERFGDKLVIGDELKKWAKQEVRREDTLGKMAAKDTAVLKRLPNVLPQLYEAIHLGPLGRHMTPDERITALAGEASFQAADVEFLAEAPAPLNANQQGLGKTIEWIAAVYEAGLEKGDHLVIAPKAACDTTWATELEHWQQEALERVGIFMCVSDKKGKAPRQEVINRWLACELPVRWVVVNPAMLQLRKDATNSAPLVFAVTGRKAEGACRCDAHQKAHVHYKQPFPELYEYQWRTICIDEAHKGVVRNHKSLTYKSLKALELTPDGKPCLMTGTPMKKLGGADIYGILSFLRPDVFTSYWRIADGYFEVTDNGFGKKVGKLREDKAEAFFRMLTPYVLRRTKKEAAPWLPDKLYVDVDVEMSKRQRKQYRQMETEALTHAGTSEIFAGGVLDRITRLKQFANAHSKIDPHTGDIIPVHSPKVDKMFEWFDALNMFDEDSDRKCLIFSQSRRMVKYIADRLEQDGRLPYGVIHGGTKDREKLRRSFQDGPLRVMVIVTTAGGVSLTLDAADDVHLIDEMWSPDEDEQAEDRAHRVSRIHQVTVYTYRMLETIDHDIAESKWEKKESHELILDLRRLVASRT